MRSVPEGGVHFPSQKVLTFCPYFSGMPPPQTRASRPRYKQPTCTLWCCRAVRAASGPAQWAVLRMGARMVEYFRMKEVFSLEEECRFI
jgi:hypothetical protein